MENKASAFIVGAPKCGTTALSEYLREHPQVLMSSPKEPYFFADDLPGIRKKAGFDCDVEEYEELFATADSDKTVFCDASVYYLYSEIAAANIAKYNSAARIIVMLRNPVEMIYSYHSQMVYGLYEDVLDFEKAWRLSAARRSGANIPGGCTDDRLLDYERLGLYSVQLERLFSAFDRRNVKVILFDDFVKDTGAVYRETLEFLSIRPVDRRVFQKVNENKVHRFRMLERLSSRVPRNIVGAVTYTKSKLGIKRGLLSFNRSKQKRKKMSEGLRAEVQDFYSKDVARLEALLETGLDAWKPR